MNELALKTPCRIFVDCGEDGDGRFALYRFYAYMSSAFHKCGILAGESIPGESGKSREFHAAVRDGGAYVAVVYNKSAGGPVSTGEMRRFYGMVDDVRRGEYGTMLSRAVCGSSVGVRDDAIAGLRSVVMGRAGGGDAVDFSVVGFADGIHSVTDIPGR